MMSTSVDKINQQFITDMIQKFTNGDVGLFTYLTVFFDIVIVLFILMKAVTMLKKTRAWQLFKGIMIIIVITFISGALNLTLLNYILTSVMSYGAIMLLIVFQPELRRGLEQLGTTNRISRILGMDQDLIAKKKAIDLLKKQGKKDQIIDVSDGYAQNFLIKNGLAVQATETSKKRLATELDIRKQEEDANIARCKEIAKELGYNLTNETKGGEGSNDPDVHAEPLEAQIPFISNIIRSDSPSINSIDTFTLPGSRLSLLPLSLV